VKPRGEATRSSDVEPDEQAFLEELHDPLAVLRAHASRCPEPDVLMAACAGVLPEPAAAAVASHLAECPLCRTLARDMAGTSPSGPTRKERERMRAPVSREAAGATAHPGRARWLMFRPAVAVLAVLVVAVAAALWVYRDRQAPPQQTASAPQPLSRDIPGLPLEKPPVSLPLATALVWRGEAGVDRERYLADLGHALAPYRTDDFAEAARRLEALARTHPTAEVLFYLGVCRLFLGMNEGAVGELQRARRAAAGPLAQDAAWYLSVAYARAGQRESAVAELQNLCRQEGPHQAKACGALDSLGAPRR